MDDQDRGPVLHRGADASSLAGEVSALVASALSQALEQRPTALLVLSGGRTPVPVFQRLSTADLPWQRVVVTLADERWVPPDHPDSNARLVSAHLLQGPAAQARFEPLYNGAPTPQAGVAEVEVRLAGLPWPADVAVMGMGGDGHTASWFPGCPVPTEGASLCMATPAPKPPNVVQPRLSLTPAALLGARTMILHLTGADKEALLARALMPGGDPVAVPVRRVLHDSATPCHIFHAP